MNIEVEIKSKIAEWLTSHIQEERPDSIQLQPTKKEFKGTHTFVVFPYLKAAKMAPPALAGQIGDFLVKELEGIEGCNVVQGLLNIEVSAGHW